MNRARNHAEERLRQQMEVLKESRQIIQQREQVIDRHAMQIDRLTKKIQDLDRQIDNMEIKRIALEKQTDIQKKQLSDKIASQQDIIRAEKQTRESWIDRYKKEQDDHSQTHKEVIKLLNKLKDQEMGKRNALVKAQTLSHQVKKLEQINQNQLGRVHEKEVSIQNLQRDLKTQMRRTQLANDSWQERYDRTVQRLEQRINDLKLQDIYKDTIYEDLYSAGVELQDIKNKLVAQVQRLQEQIEHMTLQIGEMEKALEVQKQNLQKTCKQLEEETQRADMMTGQFEDKTKECEKLEENKKEMEQKIEILQEIKKQKQELEEEMVEVKEKLQQVEDNLQEQLDKADIEMNDEQVQATVQQNQQQTQKPGPDSPRFSPPQSRHDTSSSRRSKVQPPPFERMDSRKSASRKQVYRHPIHYSTADQVKRKISQDRKISRTGQSSISNASERNSNDLMIQAQNIEKQIPQPDLQSLSPEQIKELELKGLIGVDATYNNQTEDGSLIVDNEGVVVGKRKSVIKPGSKGQRIINSQELKVDTVMQVPDSPSPLLSGPGGGMTPEGITGGPKLPQMHDNIKKSGDKGRNKRGQSKQKRNSENFDKSKQKRNSENVDKSTSQLHPDNSIDYDDDDEDQDDDDDDYDQEDKSPLDGGITIDDEQMKQMKSRGGTGAKAGDRPEMKVSIASKRGSSEFQSIKGTSSNQRGSRDESRKQQQDILSRESRAERRTGNIKSRQSSSSPKNNQQIVKRNAHSPAATSLGKSNIKTMIRTAALVPK